MLALLSRLLLAVAVVLGLDALWIRGKALVAQQLLERSWREARAGATSPRPWPWADTTPVARLAVPRLGIARIVLAGASGRTLAFAPGHLDGSALPGDDGNAVVAGHRDTSFRFLGQLVAGDELVVERRSGERLRFRVDAIGVFDAADPRARFDDGGAVLTLVTCYPFEAAAPGGRLRYVVRATRVPYARDERRPAPALHQRARGVPPAPDRARHRPGRDARAAGAVGEVGSGEAIGGTALRGRAVP